MYTYIAFNLNIHTEILLPELVTAAHSPDEEPDVIIRVEIADSENLASGQEPSNRGQHFRGQVADVGIFWVKQGREIIVSPTPGVDPSMLRTILLGPIFCILLRQRGCLVLHASSVAIQGTAIAFLAASGFGKSTLAEAFHQEGYDVLTDDVMALEMSGEVPVVLPSLPQIKLWPESATFAGHVLDDLPQLYQTTEKRSHRLSKGFLQTPLPLKRLYILANGPCHNIISLSSQEIFIELVRHSRAVTLLNTSDFQKTHFHHCTSLIQRVSIHRLQRVRSLDALPDLIKLIEADIAELDDIVPDCKLKAETLASAL